MGYAPTQTGIVAVGVAEGRDEPPKSGKFKMQMCSDPVRGELKQIWNTCRLARECEQSMLGKPPKRRHLLGLMIHVHACKRSMSEGWLNKWERFKGLKLTEFGF